MPNVIIYARQSSGSEEYSASVEAQISNCQRLAEQENYTVIGIYRDLNSSGETYPSGSGMLPILDLAYQTWVKAQSAKKEYRTGLGDAIARIGLGDINYILVNEMTRLYRPISSSYLADYIHQQLMTHNVTVLQCQGGSVDLNRFDQLLMTTLQNHILFADVQKKRENAISGLSQRKDSGLLVNSPKMYGIRYEGNDVISVIPEAVPIIRFIYDEIVKMKPYQRIIRECNARFGDIHAFFYPSTIYNIGRQPIYAGYQYDSYGKLIKNNQITGQEIISFDQWEQVQRILDHKRKSKNFRRNSWLPFSGRLYCGACKSRMLISYSTEDYYYRCLKPDLAVDHKLCRPCRIRYNALANGTYIGLYDSLYPLALIGMLKRYDYLLTLRIIKKFQAKFQEEMEDITEKENTVMRIYENKGIEKVNFDKSMIRLKQRKIELNQRIIAANNLPKCAENITLNNYRQDIRSLQQKNLSHVTFDEYITISEFKVTSYNTYLEIESIAGKFILPRLILPNERKYMPEWNIEIKKPLTEESVISLIYHYGIKRKKLIFEYKNLKIYTD